MKHFGTKRMVEIDEDAVAAERLTAIASRFKAGLSDDVTVEPPAPGEDAPQAPEQPN
jgi:hypothetical protein